MRKALVAYFILIFSLGTARLGWSQTNAPVAPNGDPNDQAILVIRLLRDMPGDRQVDRFLARKLNDQSLVADVISPVSSIGTLLDDRMDKSPRLYQTDHILIVKISNQATQIINNEQDRISIEINGNKADDIGDINSKYCKRNSSPYYCLIPTGEIEKLQLAGHKAVVKVTIGTDANIKKIGYVQRFRVFKSYGWDVLGQGVFGIWLPVGIFATNFQRTTNGIQFSALPVGVALGTQINVSKDFYIGLSGIAMWAISSGDKIDSGGTKQEVATLSSLGAGFLVDFSSIMYLSATHQWNFAEGQSNPGWMLGVGFGADLLKRIASGGIK